MNQLKNETVTRCISLLREYLNQMPGMEKSKDMAILALNQLHRVTAGTDPGDPGNVYDPPFFAEVICEGHPRADGTPPPDLP